MSIPFHPGLNWANFTAHRYDAKLVWEPQAPAAAPTAQRAAVNELATQIFKQSIVRGVQLIRDSLRLVLKVPARAAWHAIWRPGNWSERERAKINVKLVGYSLAQFVFIFPKMLVAVGALATSAASQEKAKWLLSKSADWTAHFDGRASQLEALKEVGRKFANNKEEYLAFKTWVYTFDAKLCRMPS